MNILISSIILIIVGLCFIVGACWLSTWRALINLKLKDLEPAQTGFTALSEKVDNLVLKVDDIWEYLVKENLQQSSNNSSMDNLAIQHIEKLKKVEGNGKLRK